MNLFIKIFENFFRLLRRFTPRNDKSLSIVILLIIIASCSPALYLPTEKHAEQSGIPLASLQQGRQIYVDHCGSCHMLFLPNQFTATKWKNEMEAMRLKITFSELEKKLMLDYLLVEK